MLRHLRIENFKAWKDTGDMELAPLSVFLGTNSSGKSSIIQFLLMLKQTMQDPDPAVVLNTGDDHSIVDVGVPSQMLYGHDTSQPLRFSYDWDVETPFRFALDSEFPEETLPTLRRTEDEGAYRFGTDVRFRGSLFVKKAAGALDVESLYYLVSHGDSDWFSVETRREKEAGYRMVLDGFEEEPVAVDSSARPLKFYGFSDEAAAESQQPSTLRTLNQIHPQLFSNLFYLGPLRDRTSRLYTWKGTSPSDVGTDGRNAVFAMLSARSELRKFRIEGKSMDYDIDTAVAEMLKKMGLIQEFRVRKFGEGRSEYEVQVKTKGSPVWADLPDVGCGVSQVLPVLVELFYAPSGSILLMEQPELHLHPSAQAALADVMIDAVRARENGKPRNLQLLIETHSEYFLRRLQRRIAEKAVGEELVRGYFSDTGTDPFQLRKLEMDAYGNILNWPKDFFGDMAGDIFAQAEAAFDRKRAEYEQDAAHH